MGSSAWWRLREYEKKDEAMGRSGDREKKIKIDMEIGKWGIGR
jgi:hypothetical protein